MCQVKPCCEPNLTTMRLIDTVFTWVSGKNVER